MLWTSSVYAVVSKVTDQNALWKNESDLEYSRHLQLQKWEKGSIISAEGSQYLLNPGLIYRQEKCNPP